MLFSLIPFTFWHSQYNVWSIDMVCRGSRPRFIISLESEIIHVGIRRKQNEMPEHTYSSSTLPFSLTVSLYTSIFSHRPKFPKTMTTKLNTSSLRHHVTYMHTYIHININTKPNLFIFGFSVALIINWNVLISFTFLNFIVVNFVSVNC